MQRIEAVIDFALGLKCRHSCCSRAGFAASNGAQGQRDDCGALHIQQQQRKPDKPANRQECTAVKRYCQLYTGHASPLQHKV